VSRIIETIDQYLAVDHLSLGPAGLSGYLQDVRAAMYEARSELTLMESKLEFARLERVAPMISATPPKAEEVLVQPSDPTPAPALPAAFPRVENLDAALDLRYRFEKFMEGKKHGHGPEFDAMWFEALELTARDDGSWCITAAAKVLGSTFSSGHWFVARKYPKKMRSRRT
jgi:hypothetical protein